MWKNRSTRRGDDRAGGRPRIARVNTRVEGGRGVWILRLRAGGRRLVWWFSIPFSSRLYHHPFRGGTISFEASLWSFASTRANGSRINQRWMRMRWGWTFQSSLEEKKREKKKYDSRNVARHFPNSRINFFVARFRSTAIHTCSSSWTTNSKSVVGWSLAGSDFVRRYGGFNACQKKERSG